MSETIADNPCLTCGACCATYRVAFHWSEADDAPGGQVPLALTAALRTHERMMQGSDGASPRCIALDGEVGQRTACRIHPLRPTPCRAVNPGDDQCVRARQKHGLPAL